MAERKVQQRFSNAEIKAGVFLTLCLALFISMLFVLGKFGRAWRGRQELNVVFTQVSALRPESPVLYNGMEIGHVKEIKITRADDALLAKIPPLSLRDLKNLPLTESEREKLRRVPEQGPGETLDAAARNAIRNRTMVLLKLDVLSEQDAQRFRVDDEYRINASLMGDNAVEINTGNGSAVTAEYNKVFLGISGDMYTDLGKSISQVKDILGSLAEIVGGSDNRQTLRDQLTNFENFTGRLEDSSGSMQTSIPKFWDTLDERIEKGGVTLKDAESKVGKMKPKLEDSLVSAQKSVNESRDGFLKSIASIDERVKALKSQSRETTDEWRKLAAEYKESIPSQIRNAREWSERFLPTVEKIDGFFTRADDQLNKGIDSTRASLSEYLVSASLLEHKTFKLKAWPYSFANTPTFDEEAEREKVWRRELATRQYMELRGELQNLRQELQSSGAGDPVRASRIDQLIRDIDGQVTGEKAEEPPKKKGKK